MHNKALKNEAAKSAGLIKRGDVAVLLPTVAQKIEAQDTGEVTKRGGRRTKI